MPPNYVVGITLQGGNGERIISHIKKMRVDDILHKKQKENKGKIQKKKKKKEGGPMVGERVKQNGKIQQRKVNVEKKSEAI